MYYKQCENCAYDIVDDEGQIMDHECADETGGIYIHPKFSCDWYVIVDYQGKHELLTWKDGDVIVYGNHEEAWDDLGVNDMAVQWNVLDAHLQKQIINQIFKRKK